MEEKRKIKSVVIPPSLPERQVDLFSLFADSLPYQNITYGASESFTRILSTITAADSGVIANWSDFCIMLHDKIVFLGPYPNRDLRLAVGSWKHLFETVPPASIPHFYLLCHLLRSIATVIHRDHVHPMNVGSILYAQGNELCHSALELERSVDVPSTFSSVAVQFLAIVVNINFPRLNHLYTPEAQRAPLEEPASYEKVRALIYLFSALMFSCGRFQPGHLVRVAFDHPDLKRFSRDNLFTVKEDDIFSGPPNVLLVNSRARCDSNRVPTACLVIAIEEDDEETDKFGRAVEDVSFRFGNVDIWNGI